MPQTSRNVMKGQIRVPVEINGEIVQDDEILDILKMIEHDCKELAGEMFESPFRSKKFRATWDEVAAKYKILGINKSAQDWFVIHEWEHLHEYVKNYYTSRLRPYIDDVLRIDNPQYEKDDYLRERIFKAVLLIGMMSKAAEAKEVLQINRDSQAFRGDKTENTHISETYGDEATIH